jgi:hypothetical protein
MGRKAAGSRALAVVANVAMAGRRKTTCCRSYRRVTIA